MEPVSLSTVVSPVQREAIEKVFGCSGHSCVGWATGGLHTSRMSILVAVRVGCYGRFTNIYFGGSWV